MADNKNIPKKEGSSAAESGRSRPYPQKRSSQAPFAALVMIKNEASSQVPSSRFPTIKAAKRTTRMENPGEIEVVSSQVPTTDLAMIKPAEQTTRVENPGKIEVVSSQVPTTDLAMIKPAEQTTRVENPGKIEVVSSQVPTTGLAMIRPAEQTARVENPPFVQNPMTKPMDLLVSDLEGNAHVSSKWESLVEFHHDVNASSRRDEDIPTGYEPTIGGMVGVYQDMQHFMGRRLRLRVNSPPFVQNPRTPPMNLLASDFEGVENSPFVQNPIIKPMNSPASDLEGNAHVSSKSESPVEFHHGMNASSRRDEDIRTGKEPMLGGMEGAYQGIQHLLDRVQRLSVDNLSFFQNPRTPPMSLLASDFEGSAYVCSEMESLFEFCYGTNPLSKPDEDIRTRDEPTLGGMEGVYQGIQHLLDGVHRLSVNSPPFVQNPRTIPINLLTSNLEENAHASFDRDTLFEFFHSLNATSIRDEDIHTGNEPMLGATGGFYQDTQDLWEQMHGIRVNIASPSEDPNLSYELSPSDIEKLGMGLLTIGIYRENSPNNASPSRIYGIGFPSNRQYRDLNLSEDPLDKRVVDDAMKLCSACNENIQQGKNPDLTGSDISEEYLKLYQERSPDNYDFAMNIMAHIELLNDNSWTATVSYFDENVKRMVTSIWNETYTIFENTVKLQGYNRDMVLKLMMHFTRLSVNENFKVETFLKYCVLLCQLGVIARKRIFKEASFYAILQLRNRIKCSKSENLVQFMLDIVVKDYAKRQHKM